MCNKYIILPLLLAVICTHIALAQDTHYWTHKYGPRNVLLGGGDDATSRDNSAIINNPGGLGFNRLPSLSITTNAYAMDNSKFKDGAGDGLDMKATQLNIIPLILSGVYKHKKFPKWTVGYALVDKTRYRFKASQRFDGTVDVLDDDYSPGAEEFVSQLDMTNDLSEIWGGIAVAYKFNDHFALGISSFGAYREHNVSYGYTARAVVNSSSPDLLVSTSNLLYSISYFNIRSITKLGASANFGKLNAGISVTVPSFSVYSDATVNGDITGVNLNFGMGTRGNFIANDRQEKLKARYRSPASISAGANYKLRNTTWYVTGEYFFAQKPYVIMQPRPNDFIRPKGFADFASSDILNAAGGSKGVFNLALGVEHKLFKQYNMLAGIRTDKSYFREDVAGKGNDLSITSADLYHASLGVVVKGAKSDICVGVKASYGRNKVGQLANISQPNDDFLLIGEEKDTHYRYYALSAILGYVYYVK